MADDIVTDVEGLRLIAWSLEGGNVRMAYECRRAADEIERLRGVIDGIDALHVESPNGWYCQHCDYPWPCPSHRLIYPQEAQRG